MNETSTFDKGFRKSFGWFLLIALAICCLPWIFAKNSWWIDFTDTGQIGDTIGGIMGPFVAIAAAGLKCQKCQGTVSGMNDGDLTKAEG